MAGILRDMTGRAAPPDEGDRPSKRLCVGASAASATNGTDLKRGSHERHEVERSDRDDDHRDRKRLDVIGFSAEKRNESATSEEIDASELTLSTLSKRIREAVDNSQINSSDESVVAFFGATGAGKTTTINFICGAKMVQLPNENEYDESVQLDVCEEERRRFLKIGHGNSMTKAIDLLRAKDAAIICCDMPGSSDDNAVDKIVNCVLRSKALKSARSVCPVVVLKLKDIEAQRYQNSKEMLKFVADCFDDAGSFKNILILVTHAKDSDTVDDGDRKTLGSLLVHVKKICSQGDFGPMPSELTRYIETEVCTALSCIENRTRNSSNVRVVRPLLPSSRGLLLDLIATADSIEDPANAFSFNLEADARRMIFGTAGKAHRQVNVWLSETFEYCKVASVLLELEQVGLAVGIHSTVSKDCLLSLTRDRVLKENRCLYEDIQHKVKTLMTLALDSIDVAKDLQPIVHHFHEMQIIFEKCPELLPNWRTVDMLQWNCEKDFMSYIDMEQRKGWDALESCAERILLLATVLTCNNATAAAIRNVDDALQSQMDAVRAFQDPAPVADALLELQKASRSLSGTRQDQAKSFLSDAESFVLEQLRNILQEINKQCEEIVNGADKEMDRSHRSLRVDVTKLFKFARPDQRIDEFLPVDCRSNADAGFYRQFRKNLKLDEIRDAKLSRRDLLQHFKLLSCLITIDDDDLRNTLRLHMTNLNAQIEYYAQNDFKALFDSFQMALPEHGASSAESSWPSYEDRSERISRFKSALETAFELLPIDEVTQDKVCTAKLIGFLEDTCSQRLRDTDAAVRREFSVPSTLSHCVSAYLLCQRCFSEEQSSICNVSKHPKLSNVLQRTCALARSCKVAISEKTSEECKSIETRFQADFAFDSKIGLEAADDALEELDLLLLIPTGENLASRTKELILSKFGLFAESHSHAFKAEARKDPSDVVVEALIDAFRSLAPWAAASTLRRLPKDPRLLDDMARDVAQVEASLVALADECFDNKAVIDLVGKLNKIIRWKNLESVSAADPRILHIKDARDRLNMRIEKGLLEARAALERARYDDVANFLEICPEIDRRNLMNDVTHELKGHAKVVKKLVHQLGWLDPNQTQTFCNALECIEEVLQSRLAEYLSVDTKEEVGGAKAEVTVEVQSQVSKFKNVLENRAMKRAAYNAAERPLKVIVASKPFAPGSLREVIKIFEDHVSHVQDMLQEDTKDLAMVQKNAVDVVQICSELHVLIERMPVQNQSSWMIFDSEFQSFREVVGIKIQSLFQILKTKVLALISDDGHDMSLLHHAHDIVQTVELIIGFLAKADVNPEFLKQISFEAERKAICDLQRRNLSTFKANMKKGDFDAAFKCFWTLKDDECKGAKEFLETFLLQMKRETQEVVQDSRSMKLDRHMEDLRKLRKVLHDSKYEPDVLVDLECFLTDLEEKCERRINEVSCELKKLSDKEVTQSLGPWMGPLNSFLKVLKYPADVISKEKDAMIGYITSFASKLNAFLKSLIENVKTDAKSLELYTLLKVLDNMDHDVEVMKTMEEVSKLCAKALDFGLSTLSHDCRKELHQNLSDKADKAVNEVRRGILDTVSLSKLLSTLKQAGNEQHVKGPFLAAVQEIKKIFEDNVAVAHEAWNRKDDGWSDQLNGIIRFLTNGQAAFQEVQELQGVAAASVEAVLKPIREEIMRQVTETSAAGLGSNSVGDVAQQMLQIRGIAGDVDRLYAYTKDRIRQLLSKLQTLRVGDSTFMLKLGETLSATEDPLGKELIKENPHVFQRLSNMMYNQHMKEKATLDIDQVIANLVASNPAEHMNAARLEQLYHRYKAKYDDMKKRFIKNVTKPIADRERELINELRKLVQKGRSVDMIEYLASICAAFSFCKSAEHYDSGTDDSCIIGPHEIQITSIIRLLSIDSAESGFLATLFGGFRRNTATAANGIRNHFMQIPTGEGKSIVLGITASIFALQGWDVDCVCYSRYLSGRDEQDFKDLFQVLKSVNKMMGAIRYLTFEDLCESHIEGIRDAVEGVITGKDVKSADDPTGKGRILLIDEADVFFTKRFYGNRHSPGLLLRSPEITSLIKKIWADRRHASGDVLTTAEYQRVATKYASIEPIVRQSAQSLAKNVRDLNNPKYAWTFRDGMLGYIVSGEFKPAAVHSKPNRTVFAFLKEQEDHNPHVTDEILEKMMGIEIRCGDFSYAALPTRFYEKIFGVTGTLQTLSKDEKQVLRHEYKITSETLIPSAYGQPRLDFNFESQLHVVVAPSAAEWHAKIDAEASDAVKSARAVLVCFKNDKALQSFIKARPKYDAAKRLDANVEDADVSYINGIVANATLPGRVTLLTRKFGRGLDFKSSKQVNDNGGVLVIQTFFSSSESEQIQIKGRTSRQGEKGSYRLVLCSEDLQAKFEYHHTEQTQHSELKRALDAAREAKSTAKFNTRKGLKLKADVADRKSWEFRNALYGPEPPCEKLALLSSLGFGGVPVTFVLLLDVSGSMTGHWKTLLRAFDAFKAALIEQGHSEETLVTVIVFDDQARTLLVDQPVRQVQPLSTRMPSGGGRGGTSFSAAFTQCYAEIKAAAARDATRTFTILFMTDGEDGTFHADEVLPMMQDVGAKVSAYNSVAFGRGASSLASLEAAFGRFDVKVRGVTPLDSAGLVEAFVSAASDDALHMR